MIPYLCYFFKKVECHHLLLFLKKCLFISGCAGPLLLRVGAEGAVLLLVDARELLIAWLLLLRSTDSRHTGLVAPQQVGSSQTRDGICVLCIGRWSPVHWTTREILFL